MKGISTDYSLLIKREVSRQDQDVIKDFQTLFVQEILKKNQKSLASINTRSSERQMYEDMFAEMLAKEIAKRDVFSSITHE